MGHSGRFKLVVKCECGKEHEFTIYEWRGREHPLTECIKNLYFDAEQYIVAKDGWSEIEFEENDLKLLKLEIYDNEIDELYDKMELIYIINEIINRLNDGKIVCEQSFEEVRCI